MRTSKYEHARQLNAKLTHDKGFRKKKMQISSFLIDYKLSRKTKTVTVFLPDKYA